MVKNGSKQIFITGASGFVGRSLIPYLLDHGFSVTALIHNHQLTFSHPNLTIIKFRLDSQKLQRYLEQSDVCIHLAGYLAPDNSPHHQLTNYHQTIKFLKMVTKFPSIKLIYFSTTAIFSPTLGPYAQSKLSALTWVRSHLNRVITIFPPFILDSENLHLQPKPGGLIGLIYKYIGQNIPGGLLGRLGSGQRYISYLDVHDLNQAIVKIINSKISQGEYNLVSESLPIDQFLEKISRRLGIKYNHLRFPFWRPLPDQKYSIADTQKDFDFHPTHQL